MLKSKSELVFFASEGRFALERHPNVDFYAKKGAFRGISATDRFKTEKLPVIPPGKAFWHVTHFDTTRKQRMREYRGERQHIDGVGIIISSAFPGRHRMKTVIEPFRIK